MASSESRRVFLIIAAFIVVGVGGALYYLLVYQPGKDREAARAQIKEWEVHWDAARNCMLGDKPLAADVGDAMTAREMLVGNTEEAMGDCTKSVAGLIRPPGNDTGVNAVEAQWPMVEKAASDVAQAYATHRMSPLGDNPLPGALDELAAAHRELRKAAGMADLPSPSAPKATVLATAPIALDGAPVSDLGGITVGGVLRGLAQVNGKGGYDVTWSDKGLVGTPSKPGLRSLPDHKWAADIAMDDKGVTVLNAGDPPVVVTKVAKGSVVPLLALGEDQKRLVLYSLDQVLQIARSTDGGATWASVPVPTKAEAAFSASPAGDRLDIAWTGPARLMAMSLTLDNAAGPLPAPTTLPAQELTTWCTGGRVWLVGGTARGYLVLPDGKGPGVELKVSSPRPMQCNTERLVLRVQSEAGDGGDETCSATECGSLPPTAVETQVGVAGDHVIRAAVRANLLAVWRDAAPPAFYHLPAVRTLYGIVDVGGVPIVLLLDNDNLVLEQAALPK